MHTAHDEIRKEKARARQRRYYQRNKEKMRAGTCTICEKL